ncbi:phage tail protein [Helicobacter anatolicus]|uniref:phage tail protein n=1 Tax=Helicobacter anatolicus TaxID=2905874 RepID=UPI001E2B7E8A|nr:phage tail protein [Helicobacter anatolicus]MCE3040464.1 phage tail protein [Helicobacter anatolicus]
MPSKYGINVEFKNSSIKDTKIDTSTPIAIIGDEPELRGLKVYNSVDEALEEIKGGTLKQALLDLQASSCRCQIIVSAFEKQEEGITNALQGIKALEKAEQELAIKPKFILMPEYNDTGIYGALKQIATKLRAVYAIELNAKNETEVKKEIENIITHRAIITFQKVQRIDKTTRPASAFIIALYANVMNSSEYGFAQTYSNRQIDGIDNIIDSVEYFYGEDCEADRLRAMGVTCIVQDLGIRAWGRGTRDEELGLSSLHSVIIFDRIIETILKSQKEAIDKSMSDYLKKVQDDLDAFYRKLVANRVLIDFKISLDEDLNTNESLAEGIVYITQKTQEVPLISKITNRIYRVSEYTTQLIKELK